VLHLNPEITPYTNELLMVMLEVATIVVQKVKYEAVVPRPSDLSPRIQPMIENPGFFAWPSGHATQAFAVAELLSILTMPIAGLASGATHPWEEAREQLFRQAERIATNRVVCGLHYPVDGEAGSELGIWLAQMLVRACTGGDVRAWFSGDHDVPQRSADRPAYRFDATTGNDHDFNAQCHIRRQSSYELGFKQPVAKIANLVKNGVADTPLGWLWGMARAEWFDLGLAPALR